MTKEELVKFLEENYEGEEIIMFDEPNYASAVIGILHDYRLIYDFDLMVECLILEDQISYEEAADFVSYDTLRSLSYMSSPNKLIVLVHKFGASEVEE